MHRTLSLWFALLALAAAPAFAEEAVAPHDPKAAFAETDTNADGRIDRQEFHERVVEIFYHGDRDKDGYLTKDELIAAVVFEEDFVGSDRNGDGKLSLYEFIDVRFDTFDEVDEDHDGVLSVEEVVDAYEARS